MAGWVGELYLLRLWSASDTPSWREIPVAKTLRGLLLPFPLELTYSALCSEYSFQSPYYFPLVIVLACQPLHLAP